jgi:hypothetical protein
MPPEQLPDLSLDWFLHDLHLAGNVATQAASSPAIKGFLFQADGGLSTANRLSHQRRIPPRRVHGQINGS